MADYWGPRKLLTAGALVASLGTFVFALAPNIYLANMGRFLIGGSVAVAWVAMLKLASHWFPPQRFATITGLALFCGVSGAVSAGVPLRILVDFFGWRSVIFVSALVTLALTVIIWLVVRDDPSERGYKSYAPESPAAETSLSNVWSGIGEIFRYRNTWLLVIAPSGIVGPLLTFSGLWGVPFLTTHYGLAPRQAAAITSVLLVAWALGGPLFGALSDKIGQRKPIYIIGAALAAVGWVLMLTIPQLHLGIVMGLAALIGFGSGSMVLGFAFVKESIPPSLSGTASGVCNAGVMMGPMILQPAVGWLLDLNWQGEMANGVRIYDLPAYRFGFTLMIVWSVLSVVLLSFTQETNCRPFAAEDQPSLSR